MTYSESKDGEMLENTDETFLYNTVKNYTKILYNFIRRFGFSQEDTEDILQDIFIKIWKYNDKFNKEKSSFKTWIFTIAKNTVYDALRKKRNKKIITSLDEKNDADTVPELEDISLDTLRLLEREENKKILLQAIESLNENEKTILLLHTEESMTFNEIATIFDSPLNTIKSNYRRSLHKLETILKDLHQLQK